MSEHDWVNRTVIQIVLVWLSLLTITQYLGILLMTKSRDELDQAITDVENKEAAEAKSNQDLRAAVSALLAKLPASADYEAEVARLAALGVTADSEQAANVQSTTDVDAVQ